MKPRLSALDALDSGERKQIENVRANMGTRLGHKFITLTGKDEFMEAVLDMFRNEGWMVVFGTHLLTADRWGQQVLQLHLCIYRDHLPLVIADTGESESKETPAEEISPILMGATISA